MTETSAGHAIVATLEAHGVDTVFAVPGESYLEVLDGLHDSSISTVVCRHEGGAAYAAEATGKLGTVPGIAMVTRGPGAANAMIGIHTAHQDATPMVLFVGLVPVDDRGRESFQEFDLTAWFGSTAKAALTLEDPQQASALVDRALSIAASGRPGPVVIGLPEDIIRRTGPAVVHPVSAPARSGIDPEIAAGLTRDLLAAQRPLVVLGGSSWTQEACTTVASWLEAHGLPAAVDWRGEGILSSDSPSCIGALGYGRPDSAAAALDEADLVVVIGTVLGDVITDGYQLRQGHDQTTVVINPDPDLLGHGTVVTDHLVAAPVDFASALARAATAEAGTASGSWRSRLREGYLTSTTVTEAPRIPGAASMTQAMKMLAAAVDAEERITRTVITAGAGNHTAWIAPTFPTRDYGSLLSTRNGAMGYSIPAAVAAGCADRSAQVIAVCGDGEFMMNANELATAAQEGLSPLIVVMDNGQFGTIRAHQEHWYPGRVSGTQIRNPQFADHVRSVGGLGFEVDDDDQLAAVVPAAVDHVAAGRGPALIHLHVAPEVLLP